MRIRDQTSSGIKLSASSGDTSLVSSSSTVPKTFSVAKTLFRFTVLRSNLAWQSQLTNMRKPKKKIMKCSKSSAVQSRITLYNKKQQLPFSLFVRIDELKELRKQRRPKSYGAVIKGNVLKTPDSWFNG